MQLFTFGPKSKLCTNEMFESLECFFILLTNLFLLGSFLKISVILFV